MDPVLLKRAARAAFESVEADLGSLRRWMFEHPEVALEEYETSARLAEFLGTHGFSVEYPAFGMETAFVARSGSAGPERITVPSAQPIPTPTPEAR